MAFPPAPALDPWTIRARWVFPADAPPIPDGRVTMQAGSILRVEGAGPADLDAGNAALLPGLVNAHVHLDLGGLRGRCPPTADFPAWLRCVIAGRRTLTAADVTSSITAGIAECLRSGTTLLGDVSAGGSSWPLLAASPLRAVVFYELIGLPRDRAAAAWQGALDWLRAIEPTERCGPGLSPHAPYSVRRDLFIRAAQWGRGGGLPLAIHLAESAAEVHLLHEHAGPFVDFLQDLGVWSPDGLASSAAAIVEACAAVPQALLIHGNYLPADIPLTPTQAIVYCPRTHAAFGHPPHPFRNWLGRGVRVALGTDSLASNPDLDVLTEARFVHDRYADVPGDVLLRMLTLDGAAALGRADAVGSLTPGKYADLVVLPLPDAAPADPHALLWESALPVQAVLIGGRWA